MADELLGGIDDASHATVVAQVVENREPLGFSKGQLQRSVSAPPDCRSDWDG
ncbi:hypothetical protein I552_4555 [Mycobacterium xenopi 3993]|nr:hypothetical protein I552_4555 [Mycobacterium xenopi 3993]